MKTLQNIWNAVSESFVSFGQGIVDFLPLIIAALVVLLIGWLLAKFFRKMITKLLKAAKLDELLVKLKMDELFNKIKPGLSLSAILGSIAYYLVMLVFITASANILQWDMVTGGIEALFAYLPTLLIALVLFLIGYFVCDLIRGIVYNAANSIGISGARVISNIIYYILLVIVGITSLNQAGINTDLLTSNMSIILGMLLLAFAISYGLASRSIVTNMLSAYYGKGKFKEGQYIKLEKTEGEIIKIDTQSITLRKDGRTIVLPTKVLSEEIIEIIETK